MNKTTFNRHEIANNNSHRSTRDINIYTHSTRYINSNKGTSMENYPVLEFTIILVQVVLVPCVS